MRFLGVGIGLIALAGCGSPPLPVASVPPAETTIAPPMAVMGAVGCSAQACHGGPAPIVNGRLSATSQNAYTIWHRHDRHAEAYSALEGLLAQAIIAKLRRGGDWLDAHREPRCLACHATIQEVESPFAREGVTCDACHTAPGGRTSDWFEAHKTKRGLLPGMRVLGTASERAAVCVTCHVGAPGREVTHDLLAAGHPRLNFEYLTYLDLMPRHWHQEDRGPEAWYAGQVAVRDAGKAILANRTASGVELADWNCFACHHDLGPGRPTKPRQVIGEPSDPLKQFQAPPSAKTLIASLRLPERYASGELDRLTWDDAAQTYYALRAAGRRDLDEDLNALAELLRLPRGPAIANSPIQFDSKAVAKRLAAIGEKGTK